MLILNIHSGDGVLQLMLKDEHPRFALIDILNGLSRGLCTHYSLMSDSGAFYCIPYFLNSDQINSLHKEYTQIPDLLLLTPENQKVLNIDTILLPLRGTNV